MGGGYRDGSIASVDRFHRDAVATPNYSIAAQRLVLHRSVTTTGVAKLAAGRGQLVGVRKFSFPSTSGSSLTPSTSLPQVPSLWVSHSVSHYVRTHELGSDGTAALGHDGRAVKRVPRWSLGASRAAWRAAIDATLVSFEAPAERAPNQDAACSAVAGACLLRGCGTLQELSHLIPRIATRVEI